MDRFLERFYLLRLNQEDTENKNRPIKSTEMETLIKKKKKLLKNKSPGPGSYTGEFSQTFIDLTSILLKIFQKIAEEGTPPSSFYKATITMILKPDKDTKKKITTGQYH